MAGYQPKKRKLTAEINVVPYIDVMLVLLIIFMATAPFISQGVDVELPQATTAKSNQDDSPYIIVEIDKNGHLGLSVNSQDMQHGLSMQQVIIGVKAERSIHPTAPVAVGGDATTPYAKIVLVLDQLSQAGVEKVGLLTDIDKSER